MDHEDAGFTYFMTFIIASQYSTVQYSYCAAGYWSSTV